ncbi:MAG: formin (ISS) [Trebouxia sp. A1-2]|nr:MAG: formin (ISS) [Trebouxia sp. A1-2]
MQHAVRELAITSLAKPAIKLPEPTIPAPELERLPQQHRSFVFVDMVNMSTIAVPLAPGTYQMHGTDYAFNKLQLREEQPLLNLQQFPKTAETSAFLTLHSIAALCSKGVPQEVILPSSTAIFLIAIAIGLCLAVTVMMQANRLSCLLHQEKQQHLREVELQDQQQHAHTLAEYAIKHASMVNRQIEHVQQANAELSWNNSELNTRIQKANNLLDAQQEAAEVQQAAARLHQENNRLHASETQLQQVVMGQQASLANASKVQASQSRKIEQQQHDLHHMQLDRDNLVAKLEAGRTMQEDRVARLADSSLLALEIIAPACPILVDTGSETVAGMEPFQQVRNGVQTDASLVPVTLDSCAQVQSMTAAGKQMVAQAEAEDAPPQPSTPVTQEAPAASASSPTAASSSGGGPRAAPPPPPPPPFLARRSPAAGQAVAAPAVRGVAPPPPPLPPLPPPGRGKAGSGGPPPPPPPPPLPPPPPPPSLPGRGKTGSGSPPPPPPPSPQLPGLVKAGPAGAKQAPCDPQAAESSSLRAKPQPGLKLKRIHWEVNDQVKGTVFSRSPTIHLPSAAFAELDEVFQVVPAKQVSKSSSVKSTKLLMYSQQQTQGRGFAWAALRMKPDAVLAALRQRNGGVLSHDNIKNIKSLLPNDAQHKDIARFLEGKHSNFAGVSDPEVLEPDDRFMVRLAGIPYVQQHVDVLLFRSSFEGEAMHVEEQLQLMVEACDSLHSSVHLANVVHGLLASGNHLNYGAASKGVPGFKIGAVDTAAGVKGSCKESLLCVVLKHLKSHDCSIEEMAKELAPVTAAGDLQMNAIQASIGSLKEGLHTWDQRLKLAQEDEGQDAQELQQACTCYSQAVSHVCRLQELCRHAVDKLLKAAAYLGEPFDKEKPAGVLQTVHTQSKVILKTLSEIKEAELQATAKLLSSSSVEMHCVLKVAEAFVTLVMTPLNWNMSEDKRHNREKCPAFSKIM